MPRIKKAIYRGANGLSLDPNAGPLAYAKDAVVSLKEHEELQAQLAVTAEAGAGKGEGAPAPKPFNVQEIKAAALAEKAARAAGKPAKAKEAAKAPEAKEAPKAIEPKEEAPQA